jgi:hypothetical protein
LSHSHLSSFLVLILPWAAGTNSSNHLPLRPQTSSPPAIMPRHASLGLLPRRPQLRPAAAAAPPLIVLLLLLAQWMAPAAAYTDPNNCAWMGRVGGWSPGLVAAAARALRLNCPTALHPLLPTTQTTGWWRSGTRCASAAPTGTRHWSGGRAPRRPPTACPPARATPAERCACALTAWCVAPLLLWGPAGSKETKLMSCLCNARPARHRARTATGTTCTAAAPVEAGARAAMAPRTASPPTYTSQAVWWTAPCPRKRASCPRCASTTLGGSCTAAT